MYFLLAFRGCMWIISSDNWVGSFEAVLVISVTGDFDYVSVRAVCVGEVSKFIQYLGILQN
jgi:hypothetical protein